MHKKRHMKQAAVRKLARNVLVTLLVVVDNSKFDPDRYVKLGR